MGQCVSRSHPGPYSFSRHYDAESLASTVSGAVRRLPKKGTLQVVSNTGIHGTLEDVLFCPDVPYNLLSVTRMQQAGMTITFDQQGTNISKDGKIIMQGKQIADVLTKPLPAVTFNQHRDEIGLCKQ